MARNSIKDKYLPKTVQEGEEISLTLEDVHNKIPHFNVGTKFDKKTQLACVKYPNSSKLQTDVLFEDVIVEQKHRKKNEVKNIWNDCYILAGIPTKRYRWLQQNLINCSNPTEPILYTQVLSGYTECDADYSWVQAKVLPELTQKEYVSCLVYKKTTDESVSAGTLEQVSDRLQSNLMGYGQFTIVIEHNWLHFYLTGFQLINTTCIQSSGQPELKVSPPDALIEQLEQASLLKN